MEIKRARNITHDKDTDKNTIEIEDNLGNIEYIDLKKGSKYHVYFFDPKLKNSHLEFINYRCVSNTIGITSNNEIVARTTYVSLTISLLFKDPNDNSIIKIDLADIADIKLTEDTDKEKNNGNDSNAENN